MAIKTGFYNSLNGDRKYNAEDMSNYFSGLFTKGVLENYKGKFTVKEHEGMQVRVSTGKAYFSDGKYIENTADIVIQLDPADVVLGRKDIIVLRNDKSEAVRNADVVLKKGIPSANPSVPELVRDGDIEELLLCVIDINKLTESITQAQITNMIPNTDVCGYVTGLIDQVSTEELFLQYETAYKQFADDSKKKFDDWFVNVKETLSTVTLIREYTRTYTTVTANEKKIAIGIPQYNSVLDILDIYINGLRLNDNEYTKVDFNSVELLLPVDAGTDIQFTVYKSVDGSEAETVIEQVEELQEKVHELRKYTYYATGVYDNKKLSQMAQDFYNGAGLFAGVLENAKIEIKVVGTVLSDNYIRGTGTSADPYVYFDLGKKNASTRKIVFDFTSTNRLGINGVAGKENVAFAGDDYEVKGIRAVMTSGSVLTAFNGEKVRCKDAEIYINGAGTEVVKGCTCCGTFINTRMSATALNAKATGFISNNAGILKLVDCEIIVYNGSTATDESVGVLVEANNTEAVLMMTNCNLPIRARGGYKQSQTVKVNSGYCALSGNTMGKTPALYSTDVNKCSNVGTLIISK